MSDNGLLLFSDMAGFMRKNEGLSRLLLLSPCAHPSLLTPARAFPPTPLHLNFQIIGCDFWLHVYGSFHVINLAHSVELKNTDCK